MSIIGFSEIHRGRDGDDEATSKGTTRNYTRAFLVTTSNNFDAAHAIFSDPRCPLLGAVYPSDLNAYLTSRKAENDPKSKRVWTLTCKYTSKYELSDNPLAEPAEVEWFTKEYQRPAEKDIDGNAILNSAGDQYTPPPEVEDSRLIATVKKNVLAAQLWLFDYRNAINSDTFMVDGLWFNPRQAQATSIKVGKWQFRNDIPFRVLTMDLCFRTDDWVVRLLDQGFNEKVAIIGGYDRRAIIGDDNRKKQKPTLLDGTGQAIRNPDPTSAVFREHYARRELPFSALPLF